MTLNDAIDEFLVYLTAVRTLSENTIISYRNDFEHLCRFLGRERDISTVSKEDLLLCIGKLSEQKKSPASVNRFIAAVRSLFAYCKSAKHLDKNPSLEVKSIKNPKKIPRFMTREEVNDLCQAPLTNEILWANRDNCIFEMLYSSGCRVSELCNLKLSDFTKDYKSAVVRGKGNKDRYVFFGEEARKSLSIYLDDRRQKLLDLKAENCPYLFINQRGKQLSTKGLRWILSRYSGPEGTNHAVSPHAFRHTFATQMLSNGADVRIVQEMLGHASVSTTQRYTHITTEQLIEIYSKAHPHN